MSGTDNNTTPNYSLNKPVPNAANDIWGDLLNQNSDILDSLIHTIDVRPAGAVVSDTLPSPIVPGTLWFDSVSTQLFCAYDDGSSVQYVVANGAGGLPLTGGTLTGPLTLPGNATQPLHAVPLQQLNSAISAAPYVELAGDTMTGSLTIQRSSPALYLDSTTAGQNAPLVGLRNGKNRWAVDLASSAAEAGSNVGSDFSISRWSDAGAYIDTPLSIRRDNGNASFSASLGLSVAPPAAALPGSLFAGAGGYVSSDRDVTNILQLAANVYQDAAGTWKMRAAGQAVVTSYSGNGGGYAWYIGQASAAAGDTVTWSERMRLDSAGALLVPSGAIRCNGDYIRVFGNTAVLSATNTANNTGICLMSWNDGYNYIGRTDGNGSYNGTLLQAFDSGGNATFYQGITSYALIHSANGRVMAKGGSNPCCSTYNTAGYAGGMWCESGGNLAWGDCDGSGNPNQTRMWLDRSSNLYTYGSLQASGSVRADGGNAWFGVGGNGRVFQFQGSWYWDWNWGNGVLAWMRSGAVNWVQHANSSCYNNENWVGGYGAYQNLSDERYKEQIEPASYGLDEILRLRPIRFRRKPIRDEEREPEVGFSAQQVQAVLPEAIRHMEIYDRDGKPSDALSMATTPIVAALVKAVQQLTERVEQLEAEAA